MKTSELIGPALDWAVAKCEGFITNQSWELQQRLLDRFYNPSTDWAQGGPIIEREKIAVTHGRLMDLSFVEWHATDLPVGDNAYTWRGPTPLLAAMRCYVASKLGDEVEIPEELK